MTLYLIVLKLIDYIYQRNQLRTVFTFLISNSTFPFNFHSTYFNPNLPIKTIFTAPVQLACSKPISTHLSSHGAFQTNKILWIQAGILASNTLPYFNTGTLASSIPSYFNAGILTSNISSYFNTGKLTSNILPYFNTGLLCSIPQTLDTPQISFP